MLKHCSPSSVDIRRRSRRNIEDIAQLKENRSDSVSLNSYSTSTTSSSEMSPKSSPVLTRPRRKGIGTLVNRNSTNSIRFGGSNIELNPQCEKTPIKIYAKCLQSEIEYKTLLALPETTSRDLILMLLSKYRMKHRDPKLFYITMDILPLNRSLILEDEARPLELKACHPWGDCKFSLQMRKGCVIRIYDSVLMEASKYKCLLISEETRAKEVIQMLFKCYSKDEFDLDDYYLVEINRDQERPLKMDERPMELQEAWNGQECSFVLKRETNGRRNLDFSSISDFDLSSLKCSLNLTSILNALPGASVDSEVTMRSTMRSAKRSSMSSSMSVESRQSENDNYFYI